jgi:hypothetical protein
MRALLIICALATAAHADDVHVGFGLTGSSVAVSDRNGTGMVTEIKKMVNDQVAVGGRVEVAVMFGGVVDDTELSVAMAASGLAKGEVFLTPGQIRPFVGFGIGGYTVGAQTALMSRTGRYFGVAPQVGIELGRVRFAGTYNEIIGTKRDDYFSLELSFEFAR